MKTADKRPNLAIDEAVLTEAREHSIDADLVAERAIRRAIVGRRSPEETVAVAREWREENAAALEQRRKWVQENGMPLEKWQTWKPETGE